MPINQGSTITITSGGVSGGGGGGGSSTKFVHDQPTPASTWSINHALGTTDLVVEVTDATGETLGYDTLTFDDNNNLTITFADTQSGKAVILG